MHPSTSWPRSSASADWSVIDVETTGLWPSVDRVVEIGLVRLSPCGEEIASWTTVIDPDRDVGASEIHGLTAGDLRGAPRFADVAPGFLAMIGGTRIAAHNARFDLAFLTHELDRAGASWGTPDALCTMITTARLGLSGERRLSECCRDLDIELIDAHCAISDARAASCLLACALGKLDRAPESLPAIAPRFPAVPPPPSRTRSEPPPPRMNQSLGSLAARVGVPSGLSASGIAASQYLDLLDRVLEDRRITDDEIRALAAVAQEWDLDVSTIAALNAAYLGGVWNLALADGIVTDAERRDLVIVAELLGVPLEDPVELKPQRRASSCELAGKSVCFTGASVVTIRGVEPTRQDQERLARDAGMVVKDTVSGKLDILVLADPDSRSGKAKKADELGVRKMAEPVFWRALGVEID
jgi:DNA polymerase-3 subunit epsilon